MLLSDRRFAKGNGNQFVGEYLGYDLCDDLLMELPPPPQPSTVPQNISTSTLLWVSQSLSHRLYSSSISTIALSTASPPNFYPLTA